MASSTSTLNQEQWIAANPAPTYSEYLSADPTLTQMQEDLREGKSVPSNDMFLAQKAVQSQFNEAYNKWLDEHDNLFYPAPLPKRDYAAERGYKGNVLKPEQSDFRNAAGYNQAMDEWGSTVRNVPPPIPDSFRGGSTSAAYKHAMEEWEAQQKQVDDLVSFKRALFGERAIVESLQRHNWDYDTYIINPNLYMDRLLEAGAHSRDAYKEYDQEKLERIGFYAFDARYTTLADGTIVDDGQLTTQQWRDFSAGGGRSFDGYGYREYDAIYKYNNMISRGVDATTAQEWFDGYSDDMTDRNAYLRKADEIIAEEFERKRQGYIDYMDEIIQSGDIGKYLQTYMESPHHLKMTLLESRRDRGFIEEDDYKQQFVQLLNENSDNTYFFYDVENEQFVGGPSLTTEEKEKRGDDGDLIFEKEPRIELFSATPYALAQMGIGDPEDFFEQTTLGTVTDFLFGAGGDPRELWNVVSDDIYDSFKDQDDPEDTMKQYDLLYAQKAIGQEQSYWDSTQDQVNRALNSMSLFVSLMGPIPAAVMVTLKAANGQTLTGLDYATLGMAGLQLAGMVTPPASAADAEAAAEAAEAAAKAGGASAEAAAAAGAAEKAKLLAGVGLGAMTYNETVLLLNALGSGDPKEFLMTQYGGNFIESSFARLGLTTDNFSPVIIDGLNEVTNKMLAGESFEDALASAGSQALRDWIDANGVGDDIEKVLKDYGLMLSETAQNALSVFDDEILQPVITGIEKVVDFADVAASLSKFDDEVLQPIVDGFEAVADKIDTKVLTPISDAATSLLDGFINTSIAAGIPLDSIDAVRERLRIATGGAFENLPEGARDAIEEGLKGAIIDGEIDEAAMTEKLASATITTKIVEEAIGEYANDVVGARLMTQAINSAVVSAALGGNASDAFLMTIGRAAAKATKDSIRDGTFAEDISTMADKVTGDYTSSRLAAEEMDKQQKIYTDAYGEYNDLVSQMQTEADELDALRVTAETTGRQADIDKFQAALTAFEDKVVNEYADKLNALTDTINTSRDAYDTASVDYNDAVVNLNESTLILNDNLAPAYSDIEEATILELSPDFNEQWYREHYNIPEGESAYAHYIANGLTEGAAQNKQVYAAQYEAKFNELMTNAMREAGVNPAKMTDEELQRVRNNLINKYGGNIESLQEGIDNVANSGWRVQSALMAVGEIGGPDFVLTEENIDAVKERFKNAGMDYEDLQVGDTVPMADRRKLVVNENNQMSAHNVSLAGATDWADVVSGDAQLVFNADSGKLEWSVLPTEGTQAVSYDDDMGIILQSFDPQGNQLITAPESNRQYVMVDGELKPFNGSFDGGIGGESTTYVNGLPVLRYGQTFEEPTEDGGFRFYESTPQKDSNGDPTGVTLTWAATYDADGNMVGIQQVDQNGVPTTSYDALRKTDPELWLASLGQMPESVGEEVAGNWWYRVAKRVTEALDNIIENDVAIPYVPYGTSADYLYTQTLLNAAAGKEVIPKTNYTPEAFVVESVGSINSMNSWLGSMDWFAETLANLPLSMRPDYAAQAGLDLEYGADPTESNFYKVTQAVSDMSEATLPEDYKEARDRMYALLENEGVFAAMEEYPAEFAQEIFMRELKEELPTLFVGGALKLGSKAVTKGFGATDETAAAISSWTGFSGAVALDMAEAYGGEARGAYEELYALATTPRFNAVTGEMELPMTEEEAEAFALDGAAKVGTTAMMLTGLTIGIGGADMYKAIFGKPLSSATQKQQNVFLRTYESLRPASSEAVTGALEEAGTQAALELIIYNSGLDPDRDYSQQIQTAATLGFILEGTVGQAVGSLSQLDGGSVESRILMNGNGPLRMELAETIINEGSASDIETILDKYNVTDNVARTDILNFTFDDQFYGSQEVSVAFEDIGYAATADEIAQFIGAVPEDAEPYQLLSDITEYTDPLFVTTAEVQEEALKYGVTLTDEEASAYTGQRSETDTFNQLELDFGADTTPAEPEDTTPADPVDTTPADPVDTTPAEPEDTTPAEPEDTTPAEPEDTTPDDTVTQDELDALLVDINSRIDAIMANDPNADRLDAIDQAIDDIVKEQDKFATHIQLAASLGGLAGRIDADILEVANSVADVETRLAKAFDEALEEEGTTRDEAIAAAVAQVTNDLGITREELLETINTEDATLNTRITTVRDRLQKQINTLRDNVWNSIGNLNSRISANDITDAQLEAEIDALAEELGTTREDIYDLLDTNTAELNALNKEVSDLETDLNAKIDANQQAGMERDDAMAKAIADIVAESEDFTTHAEVAEYLSEYRTGEEITAEIQTVADSVTELEERLVALINANTDADLSDTEKLDQAIADLAADLGVDIGTIFSRLGAAADARQRLDTRITTVRDNINARITRVRNQLQEQINANRRAGMDEDAALQAAIDKVAGDLDTTEQGILDQLGTTREALEADIAGLQTQVDDITAQINDLMNQGVSFDDALAQIAGDLQTTEDALLAQMGKDKQELSDDIDTLRSQVGDVQSQLGDIEGQIAELMNQGATFDEALAQIAGDLQTTEDALLTQMGKDKQELSDDIDVLRGQVGDVQTQLGDVQGQITTLMQQGATFEEALAQVAGDLQTTEDTLLAQMGTDKEALEAQIGTVQTQVTDLGTTLNNRIDELEAQTGDRDAAITQAINELAEQQGTDTATLLAQLEAQREESEAAALLLGKPTREVTQDDIDAANAYLDSVADIEASQRPVPTAEEMLYDVNADGVIDDTDLALLQGAFAGQDVEFAADSVFAPATGLYAELEAVQAQNEALAQQQEQQRQQQQQMEQQRQLQADEEALQEYLGQAEAVLNQQTQVRVDTPKELTDIDYLFDVYGDEIFATPQQKELFTSPYGSRTNLPQRAARGGMIEQNDELLRLLGD